MDMVHATGLSKAPLKMHGGQRRKQWLPRLPAHPKHAGGPGLLEQGANTTLQRLPPLFFKLSFLFWHIMSLKGHFHWNTQCIRSVTFPREKRLVIPHNMPPLSASSPGATMLLIHFALWVSTVLILASLDLLCSAYRIHDLTFLFCQPLLNMLSNTGPDGKPWDLHSWCLPS